MSRIATFVTAALLVSLALAPGVLGQNHGGSARGSFSLEPTGYSGDTAVFAFEGWNLLAAGDTVDYYWSVNGGVGPAVDFNIHIHSLPTHPSVYNTTAARDERTWTVPESDEYGVQWRNPNDRTVNVTYSFNAVPSQNLLLVFVTLVFVILAVGTVIAVRWAARGDKAEKPPPTPPSTPPSD